MFKKYTAAILAGVVMCGALSVAPVQAKPGKDLRMIPIIVNGYKMKFPDTEPYINTDGRTMVPVRFVSEKLGASVKWEEATKTVTMKFESKGIEMVIGSKTVKVNGESITLDTAAEKHEGRTMVPLRFVSEVLDTKVEWDEGAHSVRVTDAEYQAKIDSGKVKLDPWGREYSKTWDAYWMRLSDLEQTRLYKHIRTSGNREYVEKQIDFDFKFYGDRWAERIQKYYAAQLNIDYRTINEKEFTETLISYTSHDSTYFEKKARDVIKEYVAWVKKNKVIAKGYASPEISQVGDANDSRISVPVNFKFMILSANDPSQVFLDNWIVNKLNAPIKLKKNVWYDGYSYVIMQTNYGNYIYRHFKIAHFDNMFLKNFSFYDELK
ncbi:copper amine oxidase N-terminal domain-containing protein [Paenibacillus sp. GCM10027627]|uniref:copper amine oxidase N-terminal domain-containing protein n=1 Tax=unclassified Paenibacillus TaxID=185978 RepID=UPI00362E4F3E